jgi:hypothetical protein
MQKNDASNAYQEQQFSPLKLLNNVRSQVPVDY